ncbi:hypothetical protein ACWD4J_41750 [Streptomyces sp. NPDC002577]
MRAACRDEGVLGCGGEGARGAVGDGGAAVTTGAEGDPAKFVQGKDVGTRGVTDAVERGADSDVGDSAGGIGGGPANRWWRTWP